MSILSDSSSHCGPHMSRYTCVKCKCACASYPRTHLHACVRTTPEIKNLDFCRCPATQGILKYMNMRWKLVGSKQEPSRELVFDFPCMRANTVLRRRFSGNEQPSTKQTRRPQIQVFYVGGCSQQAILNCCTVAGCDKDLNLQ